jgi:L-alanine-DL-glutamate epimerase-like enolase superfamily enzyme
LIALGHHVRACGLDIAQTDHTWSGVEIALWDLLGKHHEQPVYRLLGYSQAFPKTPYASQLFGDTAEQTYGKACEARKAGFRAVKFGWGPYGRADVEADTRHVVAAREGLGPDALLLIDAGTIWRDDVVAAAARLEALESQHVTWLEEPFVGEALDAYRDLAKRCRSVRLAGGEGASNYYAARHLIDYGHIGFVQIDTGRIGGIAPAKAVADYAASRGVTYVNHTFTTQLALAASLAPYAGTASAELCEYPVEPSTLARELTNVALPVVDNQVHLPDAPGLGVEVSEEAIRRYLVDVEIKVAGQIRYRTPSV